MGIYQLCYLKMHSGMLFLAGHTEDKEKETLLKALSDVMDAARKAMAGKSFARSPYRAPIAALAAARLPRSPIWSRENGKKCVRKS